LNHNLLKHGLLILKYSVYYQVALKKIKFNGLLKNKRG
jgi:hypothetical protein